jgi:hypothetical protein
MIRFQDNRPNRNWAQLTPYRLQALELEKGGVKTTATQLLRYGVCPCIALGHSYYLKCCFARHGSIRPE